MPLGATPSSLDKPSSSLLSASGSSSPSARGSNNTGTLVLPPANHSSPHLQGSANATAARPKLSIPFMAGVSVLSSEAENEQSFEGGLNESGLGASNWDK